LLAVVLVFAIALVGAYLYWVHFPLQRELPCRHTEEGRQVFHRISLRIQDELSGLRRQLQDLAAHQAMRSLDRAGMEEIIRKQESEGNSAFHFLLVLDKNGRCILRPSNPSGEGKDCTKLDFYGVPRDTGKMFFGKARPIYTPTGQFTQLTVPLSAPIVGAAGEFTGVLTAGLNMDLALRQIMSTEVNTEFPRAEVLDRTGVKISDSAGRIFTYASSLQKDHPMFRNASDKLQIGPYSFRGVDQFGYAAKLPETGWILILNCRMGSTVEIAETIVGGAPFLLAIIIAGLLLGVLLYVSHIVRPIHRLTSAIIRFGETGEAATVEAPASSGEMAEVITAFNRMSAERRQFEKELVEQRGELRALANQIVDVEQRTRHEVATYLHDDISQKLAAAKLRLEMLKAQQICTDEDRDLAVAIQLLGECLVSSANMTATLADQDLRQLGLFKALERMIDHYQDNHETNFEFTRDCSKFELNERTAEIVYRGVRELLHNIVKHARATRAAVKLSASEQELCIEVRDDGIGFDAGICAPRKGVIGGFGLFSLGEHLDWIGGRLSVESTPGRGCLVSIRIPLESTGKDGAPPGEAGQDGEPDGVGGENVDMIGMTKRR